MNIDSLNINNVDYTLSAFNGTLICNQAVGSAKSVTFPIGYNFDGQLSFKVLFVNGHNCTNSTTYMTLNDKPIKVYSHGTLANLPIHTMTENNTTVYKSLQANTILELYYDTSINAFVVVGNPIVYSSSSFVIYADGDFVYKQTTYTNTTTNSSDRKVILGESSYTSSCQSNMYVSTKCNLTFNPSTGVLTAPTFCGGVCGNATTATNATCFAGCTYTQACTNIRCGLTSCTGTVTVSNSDSNTDTPIALCTGATAIGQSCGCSLTFNPSTGVLTTTTFCGSLNGCATDSAKLGTYTYAQVIANAGGGYSTGNFGNAYWTRSDTTRQYTVFTIGDTVNCDLWKAFCCATREFASCSTTIGDGISGKFCGQQSTGGALLFVYKSTTYFFLANENVSNYITVCSTCTTTNICACTKVLGIS